eukprot:scaffold742_cov165-Amphora_coffeaeformis.AAC.29
MAVLCWHSSEAFAPLRPPSKNTFSTSSSSSSPTALRMGLDLVTYLRTEWVSAALCTNQTPRSADVCLQLGTQDGRAVLFVPRTIREFITSSTEADGTLNPTIKRQLKQQAERRSSAVIKDLDQRADDLKLMDDESVDVVISLQAAAVMQENGLDWKRSVREAARVLKPGGRLLFVEQTELNGESYLDYVMNLSSSSDEEESDNDEDEEEDDEMIPIFEDVGYDDVDLVITPHVAGVALKSLDAGMTAAEAEAKRDAKAKQEAEQKLAEVALQAFEGGLKKRKRKKKKKEEEEAKA